jgi:hypothetical protein
MKRATAAILLICCCGYFVARATTQLKEPPILDLRLSSRHTTLKVEQYLELTATITNKGKQPVTLVRPGDGSGDGWRTPIVQMSMIPVVDKSGNLKASRPVEATPEKRGRCGNINPLKADEVFKVAPGQTTKLTNWHQRLHDIRPGRYSVVFLYANRPAMPWRGLPLGKHDAGAMRRVRNSTECSLVSNSIFITVTK